MDLIEIVTIILSIYAAIVSTLILIWCIGPKQGIFSEFKPMDWIQFIVALIPPVVGFVIIVLGSEILSQFQGSGLTLSIALYGLGFSFISIGLGQIEGIVRGINNQKVLRLLDQINKNTEDIMNEIRD